MKGRIYFLLVFILLLPHAAFAQPVKVVNANTQHGLPTNHIYSGLVDHDGYMWLATVKGVVCYNGYTFRTYTTADGLSDNDVWGLHCDRKNRIWLKALTKKMGYIYNGRYHEIQAPGIDVLYYPRHISDYDSGVFFTMSVDRYNAIVFAERNDTLSIIDTLKGQFTNNERAQLIRCDMLGNERYSYRYNVLKPLSACKFEPEYVLSDQSLFNNFFQYAFFLNLGSKSIVLIDYEYCKKIKIDFNEKVHFGDDHGQFLYVFLDDHIYKYDSLLNLAERFPVSHLSFNNMKIDGKDVTNIIDDKYWGRYITTKVNGIYNVLQDDSKFIKPKPELANYNAVGFIGDSVIYWWNSTERRLLKMHKGGKVTYASYPSIEKIRYIAPWNKLEAMVMCMKMPLALNYSSGKITDVLDRVKATNGMLKSDSAEACETIVSTIGSLWVGNNDILCLLKSDGIRKFQIEDGTLTSRMLVDGRFWGIEHDKKRNGIWLCSKFGITFYSLTTGRAFQVSNATLAYFGIRDVEKVMLDSACNIFIKDYNGIYFIDLTRYKKRSLFAGYNLLEAKCFIYKGKVVVAGKSGFLFVNIKASNVFSRPVMYRNLRGHHYKTINKVAWLDDKIWAETENGWQETIMPADSAYEHVTANAVHYKALLYYDDELINLHNQHHISIKQAAPLLRFDVINPLGVGRLVYKCKLGDSSWQTLTGNELYLPQLKPGKEYKLSLTMYDEVWSSKQFNLTLYIMPYWWQTPLWVGVFWITGTLVVIGLLIVVVLVTRHYAAKENDKKRLLTDLELRAIYSQLNPHFIFNTLNTTTYFIKKGMFEPALNHISKFAQLLRTYLESARERHILIADEILNISNYIELQQVRFGNRFTYSISVEDGIEIERMQIPSLLIQPFVENAINHGLLPKDDDGHINIIFRKNDAGVGIVCIIEDDGIGRRKAAATQGAQFDNKKSYGNDMIRELVDIFNKYEKTDIAISYEDKDVPANGTIVTITIKNPTYGF